MVPGPLPDNFLFRTANSPSFFTFSLRLLTYNDWFGGYSIAARRTRRSEQQPFKMDQLFLPLQITHSQRGLDDCIYCPGLAGYIATHRMPFDPKQSNADTAKNQYPLPARKMSTKSEKSTTHVSFVCQRCSQPIKLNRSLQAR